MSATITSFDLVDSAEPVVKFTLPAGEEIEDVRLFEVNGATEMDVSQMHWQGDVGGVKVYKAEGFFAVGGTTYRAKVFTLIRQPPAVEEATA